MNPPQVYMCSPSRTLLLPPSPYQPSGSSRCTSPKHPVLCIEPGLATRFIYDIIHVSMPSHCVHLNSAYNLREPDNLNLTDVKATYSNEMLSALQRHYILLFLKTHST